MQEVSCGSSALRLSCRALGWPHPGRRAAGAQNDNALQFADAALLHTKEQQEQLVEQERWCLQFDGGCKERRTGAGVAWWTASESNYEQTGWNLMLQVSVPLGEGTSVSAEVAAMSLAVLLASRAATLGLQNAVNVVLEMPLADW